MNEVNVSVHQARAEKGSTMLITRRSLLASFLATTSLSIAEGVAASAETAPPLEATPACHDGDEPTVSQTEGPYFKPNAPLKRDLAADVSGGEKITIAGFVLDTHCKPIPKALLEIWHADPAGHYDNSGFKLRGHQFTDDSGRWWFTTIVPGLYPGRTRHYHLKVQKPNGRVLTTQLYFPDEPENRRDGIFDKRLLLKVNNAADGKFGRFDFVL
jgi:protocatechuate 3,4-dioxygenase beta subunit